MTSRIAETLTARIGLIADAGILDALAAASVSDCMQPTDTAAVRELHKDGRLVLKLIKAVAVVRLPERIETDDHRPTIAAGNHQSLLDVFLAVAFCYNANVSCRLMVQSRYFENKIAGRWLRRIGCIPLSGDTKEGAFAEAHASLKRLELVGIMPEGRLTKPEERNPQVGPFRAGVAEMARETNAIVRPITFHRTGLAWPRGKWPKIRVRKRPIVSMVLGDPIDLHGATDQENAKLIEDALTALLTELDAEVDALERARYVARRQ